MDFKDRGTLYAAAKMRYADKLKGDDFLLKYDDGVRVANVNTP